MTYTVFLTAHRYGFVEVEANSAEEAKEKAMQAEFDGDAHWTDRELEVTGYEKYNENEEEDF